jgi:hypothetical protein
VDTYVFTELTRHGVFSAPLSSDEEFLRRIYIDLTGRIPSIGEVRSFLGDNAPDKRDRLIDALLTSSEFNDRWTMYFDDLFQVTAYLSNVERDLPGTLTFHRWVYDSVRNQKSIRQIAIELLTGEGNNFDQSTAAANHLVSAGIDNGPEQDFFDKAAVNAIKIFHGNGKIDCIGCHNGRGHTDAVSAWATGRLRADFWKIAAFFSRTRLDSPDVEMGDPYNNSFVVSTRDTGSYLLNTNYGNRPARRPIGEVQSVLPVYWDGSAPADDNWRLAFARSLTNDPQFALNFANRLFGQLFGVALVPAVDSLDPARLDPDHPPPSPWTLQASNPALLIALADELNKGGFQLRPFLRLLVTSSAYQLSSRYDGNWSPSNGTLYERHYVQRLEPEVLADAIADATGVPGNYPVTGYSAPLRAIQLPDVYEPYDDYASLDIMSAFFRGNRDNQKRSQAFSISQQLRMMNSPFILARLDASPVLDSLAQMPAADLIDEIYLRFLSRPPSEYERSKAEAFIMNQPRADWRTSVSDLAIALLNQPDFLVTR